MLEHVAIWTKNLEQMKEFYCAYFDGRTGEKYQSETDFNEHFESYFVAFGDKSRLELMEMASIPATAYTPGEQVTGLTHLAFAVDTAEAVNSLVLRAHAEGRTVLLEPHMTGDGYYEACVLDPDGNRVEITVLPA